MKCFYHSVDLDGQCSGAIVKYTYPECEMIGINYGDDFPWDTIKEGETVFMVDFSMQPITDMLRLNIVCDLIWIDHHKTAIDEANANGFIASGGQCVEVGKAGCELTWEYIRPDENMPRAVYLLGRYDVFDHSDADTLPFQYGMRFQDDTYPENQALWQSLFLNDGNIGDIKRSGDITLKYDELQNAKFCKAYAFDTEFEGLQAICANRGFCSSKLFDSVYDENKHDLMIMFQCLPLPKEMWTVSLYSTKDEVDCGVIAKKYGGGGHKGAAGFQCKELPFKY